MLARIAHELYWLGRFLSRAEHTARMLEALVQTGSYAERSGNEPGWEGLLAVMGSHSTAFEGDGAAARDHVIGLSFDAEEQGSVLSCVMLAREHARAVRDAISAEMWESVNALFLELSRREEWNGMPLIARAADPFVKQHCALFWGQAERTMLRDDAYAFLDAGDRIESADMLLRMLRVALHEPVSGSAVEELQDAAQARALLRALGGVEAFRRSSRARLDSPAVARFVIFERRYPSSVATALDALHGALAAADEFESSSSPLLRLRRLSAELDFRWRTARSRADLREVAMNVQRELDEVNREIGERFFAGAEAQGAVIA